MSAHAAPADDDQHFFAKHYFLLRRLHSLTGIVPVGVFVIMHLFTNAQMIRGGGHFQHEVDFIHSTPALLFVEIGLWLSIAFHAGLGLLYTFAGNKMNVDKYGGHKFEGNIRYTLQRITGIIALVFIFLHIATLRWGWDFGGWFTPFYVYGPNGEPLAHATTAMALQAAFPLVLILYIVGVAGVVYHWANGLWTAAITWGVTISPASQKRWGLACIGLGVALTVFSVLGIAGAMTYEVSAEEKAAVEQLTGRSMDAEGDHGHGDHSDSHGGPAGHDSGVHSASGAHSTSSVGGTHH